MTSYTLGLYEKAMPSTLSWIEKMKAAKEGGFDFIEISIDETDEKLSRLDDPYIVDDILAGTRATGMPIRSMCLSGHRKYPLGDPDLDVRHQSLTIMSKAIQLASHLGVRIIQLAGYDVYYKEGTPETRAFFEENLHKAVTMAAAEGILLGFETMETPFMNTVGKAMTYVEKINSPYLGVYPDAGNVTNACLLDGSDVVDDFRLGAGHILAIHLKETLPGKYREVPFGTGHTDFSRIVTEALQLGVHRFVGEFWYVGNADWQDDINAANRFLRSFFPS